MHAGRPGRARLDALDVHPDVRFLQAVSAALYMASKHCKSGSRRVDYITPLSCLPQCSPTMMYVLRAACGLAMMR